MWKKRTKKTLWLFLLLLDSLCEVVNLRLILAQVKIFSIFFSWNEKKTKKSTSVLYYEKRGGLSYQQTECKKSLIIFEEWIIWEKPMLQVQVLDLIRERFVISRFCLLKGKLRKTGVFLKELHTFYLIRAKIPPLFDLKELPTSITCRFGVSKSTGMQ